MLKWRKMNIKRYLLKRFKININMEDIVNIIKPSKRIKELYLEKKIELEKTISNSKITLIGSFAVPMCGKKEIDILLETNNVQESLTLVGNLGYSLGPIIEGEGFAVKKVEGFDFEIHLLPHNHPKIRKVYMKVVHMLQDDEYLRKKYERLKWEFDGKNTKEYKIAKNKFLSENIFNINSKN
jgi:GrpB-like predicted nucleotidyltransferase (UPF0157 family)